MSNQLVLELLVDKLNDRFDGKQVKVSQKYDKFTLEFVTDQFYAIEFNSNYDCAITLMTLLNFTKDSVI